MAGRFEIVVDEQGNMTQGHPGGIGEIVSRLDALEQKIDIQFSEVKETLAILVAKLPGAQSA